MKKLLLALDVSTTTTGYVVMDEDLALVSYGQFCISDRNLTDIQYTTIVTKESFKLIKQFKVSDLIIEDVYFGKNVGNLKTWCRVHGGVGMSWAVKHNEPVFMMATSARKLCGISGRASKIELQLEASRLYNLIKNSVYIAYKSQFDELVAQRNSKKLTKNQFDYRVQKLSKAFEEETGISEHIADSIILARAFYKKLGEANG